MGLMITQKGASEYTVEMVQKSQELLITGKYNLERMETFMVLGSVFRKGNNRDIQHKIYMDDILRC